MLVSGQRSPACYARGVAQAASLTIYGPDSPTVASGTWALYAPDGSVAISATAITASGAVASLALGSTLLNALDYGGGYREAWVLTLGDARVVTFERPVILGRIAVTSTVQPGDLSAINRSLPGVCRFEERDPDTGASVEVTWATYAWEKLDLAWGDILRDLSRAGRLPTRITGLDLHAYHRALTLQYIYADLRATAGDLYAMLLAETTARVLALAAGRILDYDLDDDGVPDLTITGIGPTENQVNPAAGWPWGIV